MIASTKKWKTKDELREIGKSHPDKVYIDGDVIQNEVGQIQGEIFSGYLTELPYGISVVVNHKGDTYYFTRTTGNWVNLF